MKRRVVIIGAGMGGLATAVEISQHKDLDVQVLEASVAPGGKMGVAYHDGVRFDTGPSLFTLPEVLRSLLESKGRKLEEELTLFRPDPVFRYRFADGTGFDVGSSLEETSANIEASLGKKAAREFSQFMDYSRRIWEAAAPYFVMGPAPTVLTPFKMGLDAIRAFSNIDSMRTMQQSIYSLVKDERLRSVFLRYATFNGSDPRKAPATLNCIAWVDMGLGAWGVEGGIHEVALMLERVAKEGGVRFDYDRPVRRLIRRGNAFEVVTDEGTLIADDVVVNADVRHFLLDLWEGEQRDHGVKMDPEPSTSGYNLVLKARRRPSSARGSHEVLFPERPYMEEFVDLFDHLRLPQEPTIYLCAKEKAHRSRGWEDHEPLFVMANAPALQKGRHVEDFGTIQEKVLSHLRRQKLIEKDDEVVWERTPDGLARQFPGSRGSLYGAASNSKFAAFKRPANQAPRMAGLYFASGSAHPGGGVPLCLQSGRQAAVELLENVVQESKSENNSA